MTARVPYVDAGASVEVARLYDRLQAMGRPVLNLYRALANQPPALEAFLSMSGYVRDRSSLDPGLRELVILATAHELGQAYEVAQHTATATRLGVAPAKIAAAAPGAAIAPLSAAERCAVELARQASAQRTCDDATFDRLRSHFSVEEIVDLVVTIGWYHLCAVILGTLAVEPEGERR